MTTPPPSLILHPVPAVAERLNVSAKTIRRWIDRGELPVYRLGRQLRISEVDLIAFLGRRREL